MGTATLITEQIQHQHSHQYRHDPHSSQPHDNSVQSTLSSFLGLHVCTRTLTGPHIFPTLDHWFRNCEWELLVQLYCRSGSILVDGRLMQILPRHERIRENSNENGDYDTQ